MGDSGAGGDTPWLGWDGLGTVVMQGDNVAELRDARGDTRGDIGRRLLRQLVQDCRWGWGNGIIGVKRGIWGGKGEFGGEWGNWGGMGNLGGEMGQLGGKN